MSKPDSDKHAQSNTNPASGRRGESRKDSKTLHLSGDHEEAFDAGVFRIRWASEVVASQTGTVEHVRDAVVSQHVQIVGVALAADKHVVEKLDGMQLWAQRRHVRTEAAFDRRAVTDAWCLLQDLFHPLKVKLVVSEDGRLRRLTAVGPRHDDVTVTWLSWRSVTTSIADYTIKSNQIKSNHLLSDHEDP